MISGKMNTHHSLFNFIINGNNIGSRGTAKKKKRQIKYSYTNNRIMITFYIWLLPAFVFPNTSETWKILTSIEMDKNTNPTWNKAEPQIKSETRWHIGGRPVKQGASGI